MYSGEDIETRKSIMILASLFVKEREQSEGGIKRILSQSLACIHPTELYLTLMEKCGI